MENLEHFTRKKEFLICVDSDGCAMDTMDIKHFRCFGPCLVEEWGLKDWKTPILDRWNEMNLYTMTRGINRFKGLAKMLREVHETYTEIEEIEILEEWVETSDELSNAALKRAIEKKESRILRKALSWSESVNTKINELSFADKKPFEKVKKDWHSHIVMRMWQSYLPPIFRRFWKNGKCTGCWSMWISCWRRIPEAKPIVYRNWTKKRIRPGKYPDDRRCVGRL